MLGHRFRAHRHAPIPLMWRIEGFQKLVKWEWWPTDGSGRLSLPEERTEPTHPTQLSYQISK